MFKYVSLSLSRGCLDYCDLWFPGFSPFIFWTGFDFLIFFCGRFYWWQLSFCQVFSCFIIEFIDSIEGCSPSILLIIFASHFSYLIKGWLLFGFNKKNCYYC